jgi:hypothetical protein
MLSEPVSFLGRLLSKFTGREKVGEVWVVSQILLRWS